MICSAVCFLLQTFSPICPDLGPAVNLVRMSGGEMQRRLGCARADPDDHSGSQGCPGRLGRARYRVEVPSINNSQTHKE